jgi:hypothetical protein
MNMKGKAIVIYLQGPRERFWGVLRGLDAAGVTVEGIGVDSFDSWSHQVAREKGKAPRASVVFFPSNRVERVLLDRGGASAPSLDDRFRQITGRSLASHLGRGRPVTAVPFPRPPKEPR